MSAQAIREYLFRVWKQYNSGDRRLKSKILDEVVRNLGMHRKAANRLLRKPWPPRSQQGLTGGRKKKYSLDAKEQLGLLWHQMGYMCAIRMKSALPEWLCYYTHSRCTESVRAELLMMSASTINRFLKDDRARLLRKMNSGTRRGVRRFITQVPVRDLGHTPTELGHLEMDCVAHCGDSLSGTFAWTLTVTDIASGWTECESLWGKEGILVQQALQRIEERLPFPIKALYSDNGTEFMNKDVVEIFTREKRNQAIPIFRGRPYRKNDQCFVEQKNFTHVRSLFGYARIGWKEGVTLMNSIYRKEWRLLQNFFMPQQKLVEKYRVGAKVKRTMSTPTTPFERVLGLLPEIEGKKLAELKAKQNPFALRHTQRHKVKSLNRNTNNNSEKSEWGKMAV